METVLAPFTNFPSGHIKLSINIKPIYTHSGSTCLDETRARDPSRCDEFSILLIGLFGLM